MNLSLQDDAVIIFLLWFIPTIIVFFAITQLFHLKNLQHMDKFAELELIADELAAINDSLNRLNSTIAKVNNINPQQFQELPNQEEAPAFVNNYNYSDHKMGGTMV